MWDHHEMVSQITVLGIMGQRGALPRNTAHCVNWNYLVSVGIQMIGEWPKSEQETAKANNAGRRAGILVWTGLRTPDQKETQEMLN